MSMENVMEFPDINQIKDEAAVWVVKLQGQTYKTGHGIPEALEAELRAWMAQSEVHRDQFLKVLVAWDAMGVLEELAEILPLVDAPLQQDNVGAVAGQSWFQGFTLVGVRENLRFAFTGAVAFSCALAIGVFIAVAPQQTYITDVGERESYTLEDGSVLTLNTDSEVYLDYSDAIRKVTLRRGEANFEVAKNKERPFVVYAGEGMVWAVGTAFNVNYREDYVDVVVSEGTVKVFSGLVPEDRLPPLRLNDHISDAEPMGRLKEVMLSEGEAAQYEDVIVSKETLEKERIDKKLAWQSGALLFAGETLEEAVKEISRYTDLQLVIVDSSLLETRVGGRFKTSDIDALLTSLAKSLNIKMEEGEKNQVLFSVSKVGPKTKAK